MSSKPNLNRETIRIFWRALTRSKVDFGLSLFYPVGAIFFSVIAPLCIGRALAALTQPNGHPERYLVYFTIAAGLGLIANRIGFARMLSNHARAMADLQQLGLKTLLNRSVGFHNNNVGGKLVSDAIDYPQAFASLASACFANLLPLAVILLAGTVLIFIESWILGLVVLVMIMVTVGSGVIESKKREPLRKRRLKAGKEVTAHLADSVVNVQTVKTFAHEAKELTTNQTLSEHLRDLRLVDWKSAAINGNYRIGALLLFQLLFVCITIRLVHQDPALLGLGIFAFSFTVTLSNRLFEVNIMMRNIEDALLQAEPMTEILLGTPEIQDTPGATTLKVSDGAIMFSNVTFRYQDASNSQQVFSGLDLHIKPGERIGLVGPSGGGKSTFTRLLLRFEDIDGGEISIDGQNIAEVTQASLRSNISYVPQEPLMFHRTIKENIAYGQPSASLAAVKKAAKAAHAAEFIQQLPNKYDTIVGERGVKLSGGQRQRVAIARAILKDAPILVLDEATSALDSESEVFIQDALWKLMEGRTAIVIAHRLSTIQKMDRIVVLEGGEITEQGTHKELLKSKGTYARLWAHQSGGFIEE